MDVAITHSDTTLQQARLNAFKSQPLPVKHQFHQARKQISICRFAIRCNKQTKEFRRGEATRKHSQRPRQQRRNTAIAIENVKKTTQSLRPHHNKRVAAKVAAVAEQKPLSGAGSVFTNTIRSTSLHNWHYMPFLYIYIIIWPPP